jgi:hypothetical protein
LSSKQSKLLQNFHSKDSFWPPGGRLIIGPVWMKVEYIFGEKQVKLILCC